MVPAPPPRPDAAHSVDRSFLSVALPLLLTALAILALTLVSIWMLSALRAYAHGNWLYTKA